VTQAIIADKPDLWLGVEKAHTDDGLELTFKLKSGSKHVLHWGFARRNPSSWQLPPENLWPPETRAFNATAVQTLFAEGNGEKKITLRLDENAGPFIAFDLFSPDTNRWENNGGKDFYVPLPELKSGGTPSQVLEREVQNAEVLHKQTLPLDSGDELAVAVTQKENTLTLLLLTDAPGPLVLHWGIQDRSKSPWKLPTAEARPSNAKEFDAIAMQTPFDETGRLRRLKIVFPGGASVSPASSKEDEARQRDAGAPSGIGFVLLQPETKQWLKHRGQNIFIPIAPKSQAGTLSELAQKIVDSEIGDHGWTLMHRFNLAHDLIEQIGDSREGWATIFVWLRFSAIRQLDWQRNYNTKPRELSHAQDRLTLKLASLWHQQPANRDLIRLALTCVGRGGEGQKIRDEILQIMHRHHMKEVGGTWMEQWHQKLHNNTTPDDVAICDAYIAFLRSNGNRDTFYQTLASYGVTKERLESFDRPIRNDPEFIPHLKDGLIWDFENYLKLLKSVHSAGDLDTAASNVGGMLDDSARNAVNFIRDQIRNPSGSLTDVANSISFAKNTVASRLEHESDAGRTRELLYLDLALEDALRAIVERNAQSNLPGEQLLHLIRRGAELLIAAAMGKQREELAQCARELDRLPKENHFTPDWSLHAKAALDRLARAISDGIDRSYQELQPTAEKLGRAFEADEWAIKLFSEEVVRGQPAFVLSLLIRRLDPVLRKSAKLGDWQVISPSTALGLVEVFETIREIQGKRFEQPMIIVAEKVYGDEEPPENVRAVITPSSVDLVSHVAVRARNANLLFATCYDRASFDKLKALKGKPAELKITAAGDVLFAEASSVEEKPGERAATKLKLPVRAAPTLVVLSAKEFERGKVGGKSFHLKELAGKLPDWIGTPRSIALPFGVFDAVIELKENQEHAKRYKQLIGEIEKNPATTLAEIRGAILKLELPENLRGDIERKIKEAGLAVPQNWELAASRIKQVWASKWNERAYFSRAARNWPHDAVQMAVLIQEVIAAEYAFVIHTVNPFNSNRDELYAEVVRGLGETLVGNYPGRAMSLVSNKKNQQAAVLAYPAKSLGLFGSGLIFRSDSNAEDLEGYAGAGLYDSVLLEPPREEILDYTNDKMVWDEKFRSELAAKLAQVGNEVEKALGGPQDIEGAFVGEKIFVVQSRPQVGLS
jgi:alpha-glucan,water dikinase